MPTVKTSQTKHRYDLERKTQQLDATGQTVGRLSTKIAGLLMGKHKVAYSPQTDCGDAVEVANVSQLKFTGKKFDQKKYYHYSGYQGGLKTKKLKDVFTTDPEDVLRRAVSQMLPKNKLRDEIIKRLTFHA